MIPLAHRCYHRPHCRQRHRVARYPLAANPGQCNRGQRHPNRYDNFYHNFFPNNNIHIHAHRHRHNDRHDHPNTGHYGDRDIYDNVVWAQAAATTFDAFHTSYKQAKQLCSRDGHYLFVVKRNRRTVYEDIDDAFRLLPPQGSCEGGFWHYQPLPSNGVPSELARLRW